MITVMGATGHIGCALTRTLLDRGERVRALGRDASRLAALERAGAETLRGDARDAAFLAEAFRDAEAAFTMMPIVLHVPDQLAEQRRLGEAIVSAVEAAGVARVVCLSSVGADQPEGTGFIAALHAQEQRLRTLDNAHVLLLRPGSFFENFHASLGLIRAEGFNADSVSPDVELPIIATRDIAAAATEALARRDFTGVVVRELLGPRDLSYAEATRIIGERIGRPDLEYVQLPYDEMAGALLDAGFSRSTAALHVEMTRAFNDGRVASLAGRTPETSTPTRFEDFAGELAEAYERIESPAGARG